MQLTNFKKELNDLLGEQITRQIIMEYKNLDYLAYSMLTNLSNEDEKEIRAIAYRYLNNEPLAYIFKKVEFYGLEFEIEKGVLIPREDTEVLLNVLIDYINKNQVSNIFEIGYGSGILSIVLATLFKCNISGVDINKKAYYLAKRNASKHNVNVEFMLNDFMNVDLSRYDLVFSNPPYISTKYKLDQFVLNEPKTALYGGKKGYEILFKIINKCKNDNVKVLACEFGYDQKEILEDYLKQNNFQAIFFKDLANYNRAFIAFNRSYNE